MDKYDLEAYIFLAIALIVTCVPMAFLGWVILRVMAHFGI